MGGVTMGCPHGGQAGPHKGFQMTLPAPATLPWSSGEKGAAAQHSSLPPTEPTLAPLI